MKIFEGHEDSLRTWMKEGILRTWIKVKGHEDSWKDMNESLRKWKAMKGHENSHVYFNKMTKRHAKYLFLKLSSKWKQEFKLNLSEFAFWVLHK